MSHTAQSQATGAKPLGMKQPGAKPPPPNPDQPVPMIHANTQNNHTTLVIMSAHYGSQMLTHSMVGFTPIMAAYTEHGTVTEGQLYEALWPENGILAQASTIFGPDVVGYIPAKTSFQLQVGAHQHRIDIHQMEHIIAAIATLGDTADNVAIARRVIYLACTVNAADLDALTTPYGKSLIYEAYQNRASEHAAEDGLPLVTYARNIDRYIPDIDTQLDAITHAAYRPMRHGVTSIYHKIDTIDIGANHTVRRAAMPTYVGRDGGICTTTQALHHDSATYDNTFTPERIITLNPIVARDIHTHSPESAPGINAATPTTIEQRDVRIPGAPQ